MVCCIYLNNKQKLKLKNSILQIMQIILHPGFRRNDFGPYHLAGVTRKAKKQVFGICVVTDTRKP